MKKNKWQDQSKHNQDCQNSLADVPGDQGVYEERAEEQRFGGNHIDVDRPDEIALLAFVDQTAVLAMTVHSKRLAIERSQSAIRTLEFKASPQDSLCSAKVHFNIFLGGTPLRVEVRLCWRRQPRKS